MHEHEFQFHAHINGLHEVRVRAHGTRGRYVVETSAGPVAVRSLSSAVRRAAQEIGPMLAKAQATGSVWGLYVTAGGAAALFGEWTPVANPPSVHGDPRDRSSDIARIFDEWRNRDGSPRGALDAAIRIVEIYAERPIANAA